MIRQLRRRRGQRGVAAVELAILLTFVLLVLAFGITEIGRALHQYDTLAKSARAAARYLSVNDSSLVSVQLEARNVAVCGAPSCCFTPPCGSVPEPVLYGLGLSNVQVAVPHASAPSYSAELRNVGTGNGVVSLVSVTIGRPTAVPFQSVVSFVIPGFDFGPISATMPQIFF